MRIPTIESEENLRGAPLIQELRPQLPYPGAAEEAVSYVGAGMRELGQGLGSLAESLAQLQKHRKAQKEAKWISDNLFSALSDMSKWMADEKNYTREDFADQFMQYSDQVSQNILAEPPSPEAGDQLREMLNSRRLTMFNEALTVGEQNRLDRMRQGFVTNTQQILETYRNSGANAAAADVVDQYRKDLHALVKVQFGLFPKNVSALGAYIDAELAIGIARENPEKAKQIIVNSTYIESTDKPTLLAKIEALGDMGTAMAIYQMDERRKNILTDATRGLNVRLPPSEAYQVYGDRAKVEEKQDEAALNAILGAQAIVNRLAPYSAEEQIKALEELERKSAEEVPDSVLKLVRAKLEALGDRAAPKAVYEMDVRRRNILTDATRGLNVSLPPPAEYQVYGRRAEVERESDVALLKTITDARKIATDLAPYSAGEQVKALGELQQKPAKEVPEPVLEQVRQQVKANVNLEQDDPVQFLINNNPVVKKQMDLLQKASEATRRGFLEFKNRLLKKYQGYPPSDEDPEQKKWYLRRPSLAWRMMTEDEARRNADLVNKSPASRVAYLLTTILDEYPDPEDKAIALRDMLSLPEGHRLKNTYLAIYVHRDEWWIGDFIKALEQEEHLAQLTSEGRDKIANDIERRPLWKRYQAARIGPFAENAQEVAGLKSAISIYANYKMVVRKLSLEDAVDEALKQLTSSVGFLTVNEQEIAIPRRQAKKVFDDADFEDLARRLTILIRRDLPIDKLDLSNLNLELGPLADSPGLPEYKQTVKDLLAEQAFFMPDTDGLSLVVMFPGKQGIHLLLRDKLTKRPLRIAIEDVPDYSEEIELYLTPRTPPLIGLPVLGPHVSPTPPSPFSPVDAQKVKITVKEEPKKSYSISDKEISKWLNQIRWSSRTNWPGIFEQR